MSTLTGSRATVTVTRRGDSVELPGLLRFVTPMPGLAPHTRFTLEPLDQTGVVFSLRSAPEGGRSVRLFVASPSVFFPDYPPALPAGLLGEDDPSDLVPLTVVHPADEHQAVPTANLVAPIIVSRTTGQAIQPILDDDLPLRAPLG